MSRAPTASALISTFVRDISHSLLILRHDFIGQRWPSSVIAGCRTAPGRPRRPGQSRLRDVTGDLPIQLAESGQDRQAAQTQNARSQPQSNRARLSQAPLLVLLKPSRVILVARIDQHPFRLRHRGTGSRTDVRVSDLVIGDVAAALREHGSATLDEALLLLPPP
jgi:hypothetical protein